MSTFKKDSVVSLSHKLRLNSSAHQKVGNMISIEISQDDLRGQPTRPEHCPSIEISDLLSTKNEGQSKPSRERGELTRNEGQATANPRAAANPFGHELAHGVQIEQKEPA